MKTELKSVMSHALGLPPLSQTLTPSRTPSLLLERDVLYGRPPILTLSRVLISIWLYYSVTLYINKHQCYM